MRYCKLLLLLSLLAVAGCGAMSTQVRRQTAVDTAIAAGWESIRIPAGNFILAAFVPREAPASDILTIYIEGDGLAWVSRSQPSQDPTPMRATGLELALHHPHGAAAYLARPCQYISEDEALSCNLDYWTDKRFSTDVIKASNLAVSYLKQRFSARRLALVGYSGGGSVATLVAARRNDVMRLATVAGNLDHKAWTDLHNTSPLENSLNPADAWQALASIPQVHFIGARDHNVPRQIAESYAAHFPANQRPELRVIDGFDHACCWADKWPELYPW